MAIKGGQILHVGNGEVVIDRIQTGGPGQVNVPTEKINELGNYKSVATVRDTPDLSFTLESLDVSSEIERMLTDAPAALAAPVLGAPTTATTGGTLAAGTYYYKATAINASGETTGSNEVSQVTTGATSTVTLTWAAIPGATGYRIYRSTASGGQSTSPAFVAAVGAVTTYTDTGTAVSAGAVPATNTTAPGIDLSNCRPLDLVSQFKAGRDAASPFQVASSVALPYLYLESMSYRFGLRDNATQTATLRGDSIWYNPGAGYVQEAAGTNVAGQTIVTTNPAFAVAEGTVRRILGVTAGTKRLVFGADYTESYGVVTGGAAVTTVTLTDAVPTTDTIRIVYSSPNVASYNETVHADVAVKPAAVKGRDIEIYVGGYSPGDVAGSQVNRMVSVQSANIDWRVTLEKDEELGNHFAVAQDFDTAAVTGSLDIKPRDPADFMALLRLITGVADATKVLGPNSSDPLPLDVVIKHPDTGVVLKRLHVPDARFTVPGYQGRAAQKTTVSLPFESDEGTLLVYES